VPEPIEVARWIVAGLFLLILTIASVTDIKHRRIPNWAVLALIALFIPWIFVGHAVSVAGSLAAAAVVFVLGLGLYALRLWGAGDSKLITAVALFVGLDGILQFAFSTAVFGGILALIILLSRSSWWMRILHQSGREQAVGTVPYGVAIAVGAALTVLRSMLFAPA
jgi:prepilin peptidase CpaA